MNLAGIVVALLLAASPPQILVAAQDASGAPAPDLAAAVSRSLVATGATVILGPRSAEICAQRCVRLLVREERGGRMRVEASQGRHGATAYVNAPASATLFERARAVAVQARLMITWPTDEPPRKVHPPPPPPPPPEPEPEPEPVVEVAPPPEPEPPPEPPPPPPPPPPAPVIVRAPEPELPLVPLIASAATAVAAGTFAILAEDRHGALSDRSLPLADAERMRDQGRTFQTTGLVLGGVAVVSAAVALGMWLAGAAPPAGGGAP